jgi:hypothetical protein
MVNKCRKFFQGPREPPPPASHGQQCAQTEAAGLGEAPLGHVEISLTSSVGGLIMYAHGQQEHFRGNRG